MSYDSGTPWGYTQEEKSRQDLEQDFEKWRTELVESGDKILHGMDRGEISEEVRDEFKQFVEETRQKGIYRHLSKD